MTDLVGLFAPYTSLLIFVLINMLLAASMQVVLSVGFFSVASVAFAGIGAYASAIFTVRYHLPFAVATLIGVGISMTSALLLLFPALRLRGMYLALTTLAFVLVFQVILLNAVDITGGAGGYFGIALDTSLPALVVVAAVSAYFLFGLEGSRTGRVLRVIKHDPQLARCLGINITYYRVLTLEVSAILAAISGAFTAHYLAYISPDQFGFDATILLLAMVVVGGVGSWMGAYIGAAVLTALPLLLTALIGWADVVNGILIITVMVVQPGGILAGLDRLRLVTRRRLSIRA